ncbi:hypothetical protein Pfo_028859 [Paulownia fortunei]|nr:hypothetical protein Pfo_028859 [Paulownia fortunei]
MGEREGEVSVAVLHESVDVMEIDSSLRIESTSGKHCIRPIGVGADAESCSKEVAKEACNGTEMGPCAASSEMEVFVSSEEGICSAMQERDVVLENTKLDCSVERQTEEVSNDIELQNLKTHVKDVEDATESKPCSDIQVKEVGNSFEFEACTGSHAKEVLDSTEPEPFAKSQENDTVDKHCMKKLRKQPPNDAHLEPNEVMNVSEIEPCAQNHALDGNLETFYVSNEVKEALNDFGLEPCPKNKVKETSNDDVYSEVSNPNQSPKHATSSLTLSSQLLDVLGNDHGGCGEITSACPRNPTVDGSCHETEHNRNHKKESVSTSCVMLEIPKHVSTTGIRKITFKFSKCKEDYDSGRSVVKPMVYDEFQEDYYDNELSVSDSQPLTSNGFQNHGWNALENAEMNLRIDGSEFHDTQSPFSCIPNRELKMSKKIIPNNYPTNVKKLLSTRILEGARVKYISISGEKEIPGIIRDSGYLCGCSICNFSKVVSAYEFELHAGTKTRHPNNHIYLENGKPIYSIIQELKTAPLSALNDVIKAVAGSSVNEEYFQVWKASLQCGNDVAYADSVYRNRHFGMYYSTSSYRSQPTEGSHCPASCHYSQISPLNQQIYVQVPVERKRLIKKPRHYFSSSVWEQKKASEGGTKKRQAWLTCYRDNDLHKLLFMANGLPDGTDLAYYSKGKRILGGYKQGNGIVCSCCNTEISPSQFEAHAGWAAKRQPYRHIYTSSGLTLHDIALMLASGQNLATSGSDDMCAVCGGGGSLFYAMDALEPFTQVAFDFPLLLISFFFHLICLGLQCLPADDWHCPYCRDKFGPGRKASGESRHIVVRLKRVVKAPELEPGGCVFCRSQDFSAAKFDDRTVILCDQCEKEYHVGCLRESGLCDLKELPKDKWFCCHDCSKIFSVLKNLTSSGPEVIPAPVSAAIHQKHAAIGLNEESNNEIQWRILSGKSRFPEHLLLLSRAAAIFRECFDPIVAKSGRDLIPVMVYGRNISGQEFSGMYCVVLIVKSIVVSAALLRIFGREVAELPLVATCRENQGKGYFQALFSCIERLLLSMNVKHLVLPAAEEAEPMWTKKLGFRKTSNEQMLKYTRDLQLTIFKGTSLLEKEVQQLAD